MFLFVIPALFTAFMCSLNVESAILDSEPREFAHDCAMGVLWFLTFVTFLAIVFY